MRIVTIRMNDSWGLWIFSVGKSSKLTLVKIPTKMLRIVYFWVVGLWVIKIFFLLQFIFLIFIPNISPRKKYQALHFKWHQSGVVSVAFPGGGGWSSSVALKVKDPHTWGRSTTIHEGCGRKT